MGQELSEINHPVQRPPQYCSRSVIWGLDLCQCLWDGWMARASCTKLRKVNYVSAIPIWEQTRISAAHFSQLDKEIYCHEGQLLCQSQALKNVFSFLSLFPFFPPSLPPSLLSFFPPCIHPSILPSFGFLLCWLSSPACFLHVLEKFLANLCES